MYELFWLERSAGHTAAAAPHHISNHVKNLQWPPNWHLSLIRVRQDWCSSAQTDSYPLYIRLEAALSPDTGVNTNTYHFSAMEQLDTLLIGFWAEKNGQRDTFGNCIVAKITLWWWTAQRTKELLAGQYVLKCDFHFIFNSWFWTLKFWM